MNKGIFIGIFFIFLLVAGIILFVSGGKSTGSVVSDDSQHVVIGMENYKYSPEIIEVKAGVPVVITLDDSVYGCFRDLIIPELDIHQYLANSGDELKVTFEKGTYTFACSMYMGQGKIIAE